MQDHQLPFERRPLTRRRFVELAAGASAAFVLASCGGDSADEQAGGADTGAASSSYDGPAVNLQFWNGFTGGDGPFMRQMVDRFNTEHENITVKMVVQEWGDYYQKVPAAVASGRGPDVGVMHVDRLAENAARNVIVPLDDLAQTLKLSEEDYAKVVWDAGMYQDKRYGIPLDTHPLGFYYNTAHLQKAGIDGPPTTGDEMNEALKALKGSGVDQPFWSPVQWPGFLMFTSLLKQFGGAIVNDDGSKATFNSDAGVQALEWQVNLVKNGYSPKNIALDSQYIAFKNQKNSMTWDGIWQTQDLKKTKVPWDVAALPQIGDQPGVWAGSHNMVIMRQPRRDENKLQAGKVFINWISEHSIDWAKAGQIPARNTVRNSAEFKKLKNQSTLAQQQDDVMFFPSYPGISDTITEMDQAVQAAILMKQSPKQSLDQHVKRADKLLQQNKEKYGY